MAPKRKRTEPEPEVADCAQILINDIVELSKSSAAHIQSQSDKVQHLALVLYNYMRDEMAYGVAKAEGAPILQYYSCDGTPLRTQVRARRVIGKKTIRREGKQTKEHLAQVGFLRYEDAVGQTQSTALFAPPLR